MVSKSRHGLGFDTSTGDHEAWFDFDLRLQRCGFVDPEDFRGGRGGRSVWRVACGDAETGSDAKI